MLARQAIPNLASSLFLLSEALVGVLVRLPYIHLILSAPDYKPVVLRAIHNTTPELWMSFTRHMLVKGGGGFIKALCPRLRRSFQRCLSLTLYMNIQSGRLELHDIPIVIDHCITHLRTRSFIDAFFRLSSKYACTFPALIVCTLAHGRRTQVLHTPNSHL